jgi:uncharacterized protein (TIGR02594 family)
MLTNKKLIKTAINEIGVIEVFGKEHNKRILQYFTDIGYNWVKEDETAWCSAFINWCALQCGLERSEQLNARSWLDIGEKINDPEIGDIVIFWREKPDSWKGHVGLFFGYDKGGTHINVYGGNQSNMTCFKYYPINQLLGYRRLRES